MTIQFISLFSGAGGLDLGLEQAGMHSRYASDVDEHAVATLLANKGRNIPGMNGPVFADSYIEKADVRFLSGNDILEKAQATKGEIRLLVGGPPCQSWSSAGHQRGFEDPRGQLFSDFVRLADEVGVDFVLFENVRGLLTARGPDGLPGGALSLIRNQLLARGFQTSVVLLNSADFGVAQRRVRLFVLGSKFGALDFSPTPTHSKTIGGPLHLAPWIALRDCLAEIGDPDDSEVVRPSGKLSHQLEGISPGSGVRSVGKTEATRPGGHWGYKQGAFVADLDLPARTVTANSQQDWIIDPKFGLRKLSHRECAAIQSFPSNWTWIGNSATRYRLIGNAVPPALGEAVGHSLIRVLEGAQTSQSQGWRVNDVLAPLPEKLSKAVAYTTREELRNGESRRLAPVRRRTAMRMDRKRA